MSNGDYSRGNLSLKGRGGHTPREFFIASKKKYSLGPHIPCIYTRSPGCIGIICALFEGKMTDESDGDGKLELPIIFCFCALFLGRENSKLCSGSKKLGPSRLLLQLKILIFYLFDL